ncbi:unnamed protein product, partial [Toxocara canis]
MTSGGSKLSTEIAEIDVELEKINNEIRSLKKRKQALLERKLTIERRIEERNGAVANDTSHWESDSFPWSARCEEVLRNVFKLSSFRPLQRVPAREPFDKITDDAFLIGLADAGYSQSKPM